jgi:hypothetical protein
MLIVANLFITCSLIVTLRRPRPPSNIYYQPSKLPHQKSASRRLHIHIVSQVHGVKSDCKKGALEAQAFSDSPAGTLPLRISVPASAPGVASNLTSF